MNGPLLSSLAKRADAGRPLRVGLIGAGKFGTMFLSQALRIAGLHVMGIADLSVDRSRAALQRAAWPDGRIASHAGEAAAYGTTFLTESADELIACEGLEVVIEATGAPAVGIRHALAAFDHGCHVVMVNVEADVLAGPLLARRAAKAEVVYTLAYGDQPALICELVDWARCCGFEVVCAGKGTKYLPAYHASTPQTVWEHYGFTPQMVAEGGFNARMFNSFLDGTKSAIEMAAVANATGLVPAPEGLTFPPCGTDQLPAVCKPRDDGGVLARAGTVEVVSSLERDGSAVDRDLRWGVFVTIRAHSDYVRRCFAEYGMVTDKTGHYAAMFRPYHLVGLELTVSVLRAGLCGEATGCPGAFRADVAATAKRDLQAGEVLDGEGGSCVYGTLRPARDSLERGLLPIGLAHDKKVIRPVAAGATVGWADVEHAAADPVVQFRRQMERSCLESM